MSNMPKLSTHYVLPARTSPKVLEGFKLLLLKHQTKRKILYRGRGLTGEAALSGIVLSFLDLPEADQERVLAEYVPRFEALLDDDPSPPADEREKKNARPEFAIDEETARRRRKKPG